MAEAETTATVRTAAVDPNKPTLIHLANSISTPCLWLLEELGVSYNLQLFDRVGNVAPPDLKSTHPQGKSPQFILPDGRVITQAAAVLLHILKTYDTGHRFHHPEDDPVREEQLMGLGYADASVKFGMKLMLHGMAVMSPFFLRPIFHGVRRQVGKMFLDEDVRNILVVMERELEGRQYFQGHDEPTRADFILRFYVDMAFGNKFASFKDYPNLEAWTDRCLAREGWKKAMAKTNSYRLDYINQFS